MCNVLPVFTARFLTTGSLSPGSLRWGAVPCMAGCLATSGPPLSRCQELRPPPLSQPKILPELATRPQRVKLPPPRTTIFQQLTGSYLSGVDEPLKSDVTSPPVFGVLHAPRPGSVPTIRQIKTQTCSRRSPALFKTLSLKQKKSDRIQRQQSKKTSALGLPSAAHLRIGL